MISINKLIQDKTIVCPQNKDSLLISDTNLISDAGLNYKFIDGVPIFIDLQTQSDYLAAAGGSMQREYEQIKARKDEKQSVQKNNPKKSIKFVNDYANPIALDSIKKIFPENQNSICISIGGGPGRVHQDIINVNIDRFKNVDVVADAYALPFADNSVDSAYIGAVIEHLEFPEKAVSEIFRVLKLGGKVYSDIPFIQRFHGYPNHFQNFTVIGHKRLYERAGFKVLENGVCVGPTYAMFEIVNEYLTTLFGKSLMGKITRKLLFFIGKLMRPLDKRLNKQENSYIIASTTFVLAVK